MSARPPGPGFGPVNELTGGPFGGGRNLHGDASGTARSSGSVPTLPTWFERAVQAATMRLYVSSRVEDHQRLRMRALAVAAGTSLLATGLLFACYLQGALPADAFIEIGAAIVVAILGFFAVFRSGLNLRAADPSLTLHQMFAATLVVLYAKYWANGGQPVFLILLVMAFLFGVLRLTTRKLLFFALFILAACAAVIALRWRFRPDALDLGEELLQWVALAVTLPWFALMGGYISGLRARLRKSNAEQQRALETIKANEVRLAEAQRIAGLGSWSFDPANGIANWSEETHRIFGFDSGRPAPVDEEFLRLVHADDRERYTQLIRPALCEGRSFDAQFRAVLPGGDVRWVHAVGEPVVDERGRTTQLRGTVTDITERKRHEDALTAAHDKAAAAQATLVDAIESLTEAFALFDANDRLILCNSRYVETFTDFRRYEDIAGMTFEDLVRSSIARGEVVPPEYENNVEGWLAERVRRHRNPAPEPTELELGGGRWLQVTERHTMAGGIVGVRRDVTERKQLEQRQAMEHAVTRLLAESETLADAIPIVIETICETLGWDCGARWRWDPQGRVLRCAETWSVAAKEIREFQALGARHSFAPTSEAGLIRKVWKAGMPHWIADVSHEPGFLRAPEAAKAGLHGAFAFPIRIGTELDGVMEFYVRNVRLPDAALLRVLDSIGLQIGQFIARKAAQEQLQQLAHFDYLTSLPNRNLFNQLLAHALEKAKRRETPLAILFLDLDGFKQINDTYGHDAGDHLLTMFAERLTVCLRRSDVVARSGVANAAARLGGDEFVVLLEDFADLSELEVVAGRILAAAAKPFDLAGAQGRVGASIGISVYPRDGDDIELLLKSADSAMYAAKQAGKNTYRFFSEPSTEPACVAV